MIFFISIALMRSLLLLAVAEFPEDLFLDQTFVQKVSAAARAAVPTASHRIELAGDGQVRQRGRVGRRWGITVDFDQAREVLFGKMRRFNL